MALWRGFRDLERFREVFTWLKGFHAARRNLEGVLVRLERGRERFERGRESLGGFESGV